MKSITSMAFSSLMKNIVCSVLCAEALRLELRLLGGRLLLPARRPSVKQFVDGIAALMLPLTFASAPKSALASWTITLLGSVDVMFAPKPLSAAEPSAPEETTAGCVGGDEAIREWIKKTATLAPQRHRHPESSEEVCRKSTQEHLMGLP